MVNIKSSIKRISVCVLALVFTYLISSYLLKPYEKAYSVVSYTYGSRNDIVYTIQDKLKRWGYYDGNIDGIFGYRTFKAVMHFQANNGMTPNGIVEDRTLAALGINAGAGASVSATRVSSNPNLMLLARLINGEARGEPFEGQVAVGAVVINRTRDPRFPSTIAGVIYQPGAFTATVDGQIDANIEQSSINAARDAINGWDPSGGAIYYFNAAKTTNAWIWSRPLIKIIGNHRFCS